MPVFIHEQQILYKKALAFALAIDPIVLALPRDRWYLKNQLWRSATSMPLNIAEAGGGYSTKQRLHYYRIARGSGAECSAIFDYIAGLKLLPVEQLLYPEVRELGAMLGSAIYKHLKKR